MQSEVTMRLVEIRKHEQREPFKPFRLCLSDGTSHEVRNPNLLLLTRHTVVLGILREGRDFPDESHYIDPVHIVRVETITENGDETGSRHRNP